MANPQIENGYTKISNEIMEALAKIRISGEARQMLDVIIRKTYGFSKKEDKIATTQFMELTGLSRLAIPKARKKLISLNLITVSQKGYSQILTYSFQKDYDKWKPYPKKDTVSKKGGWCIPKRIQVYTKKDTKCIPKSSTQKKERYYTKETITKESSVGLVKDYFYASYQQFLKTPYVADFGKDGRIFKGLLAGVPLEELRTLIDRFFVSEDKFIKEAGYTIGVFKSQINKLRGKNGTDKDNNRRNSEPDKYTERTETLEV